MRFSSDTFSFEPKWHTFLFYSFTDQENGYYICGYFLNKTMIQDCGGRPSWDPQLNPLVVSMIYIYIILKYPLQSLNQNPSKKRSQIESTVSDKVQLNSMCNITTYVLIPRVIQCPTLLRCQTTTTMYSLYKCILGMFPTSPDAKLALKSRSSHLSYK